MTVDDFEDQLGLETIVFEQRDGVAWVVLNRPDAANSVTVQLARDLLAALDAAKKGSAGCVVLTGAGRHFCAGADLDGLKEYLTSGGMGTHGEPFNVKDLHPATLAIRKSEIPVIAAVNGAAVAGGLDLACAADIRIASDRARFGETYIKIGQAPANGGSHLLPLLVGPAIACELIFTGDIVDAARALEIRLVNRVVSHDDLLPTVAELAGRIARGPRAALAAAKKAIYGDASGTLEESLDRAYYTMGWLAHSRDHQEGVNAALEGRTATFGGGPPS